MRITIVTGPFYSLPPAPCGAVERLWHDLGLRFASLGHEVTFLCRGWQGLLRDETIGRIHYIRRTQYRRTGSLRRDLFKDLLYSLGMCRRLPSADITVLNSFWLPVVAPWRSRRAGRTLFSVQRWPKGQMKLYRHVSQLAAVSSAVADEIVKQTPSVASLVRVVPNPIDINVFVPPSQPRSGRTGPRVILYTGRVHPEKGVHLLIDAFTKLAANHPDIRLRIVGPMAIDEGGGGDDYISPMKQACAGLPVDFVAPIYDRHALARELQAADIYCYPSLADKGESFGVAPLEAMATGLSPVVSGLSVFRDFITDGQTGVVFDHQADDAAARLAQAIAALLADPRRRDEMGRRAASVAASFSVERVADLFLNDFTQLLAQSATA
jgi:glycosyltransferase involved in cell wall biosynthesis